MIERTRLVWNRHLQWVMHDVASDYRDVPLGFDMNADMSRSVARSRYQFDLLTNLEIGVDKICQPRLHDR
ncbi:hypothetical protein D3C76_1838590 [compost metagenome]